jgi:acylphosphatase
MTQPMTQSQTKHLSISGTVQGVGYRAAFEATARRLLLAGWVRNRRDGSVEALIVGDADAIARMLEWAWRGPSGAQVRDIVVSDAVEAVQLAARFQTLPTQ